MAYGFNGITGNLDSRSGMLSQSESFEYDNLTKRRLQKVMQNNTEKMRIDYDSIGNITSKTDLGEYAYHSTKKHAVETVENTAGLISTGQFITWNAFQKATNLKDTVAGNAYDLNIIYGPDQQRWKTVLKKNNSVAKTTIFAGNYEKITEGNVTQQLYYISGGDGLAAVLVKTGSQQDIYYAHTDHLGSIISLTGDNGSPVFKAEYDAWGKQTITNNTFKFHRGYTGQIGRAHV